MFWKIYFWLITTLLIPGTILLYSEPILNIYILIAGTVLTIIVLIGLYAYIFGKKIYTPLFWRYIFWINLIQYLIYFIYDLAPDNPLIKNLSFLQYVVDTKSMGLLENLISSLLILPIWFSIYKLSQGKFRNKYRHTKDIASKNTNASKLKIVFLKVNFWILSIFTLVIILGTFITFDLKGLIGTIIILSLWTGFYSHIFRKKILSPIIWKYIFWINIIYILLGLINSAFPLPDNSLLKHLSDLLFSNEKLPEHELYIIIMAIISHVITYTSLYCIHKLSQGKFHKD